MMIGTAGIADVVYRAAATAVGAQRVLDAQAAGEASAAWRGRAGKAGAYAPPGVGVRVGEVEVGVSVRWGEERRRRAGVDVMMGLRRVHSFVDAWNAEGRERFDRLTVLVRPSVLELRDPSQGA